MDNELRRLSPRGMALYSVAAIGGGFFYIFNNAVLPLLIPSSNVLLVNLMSNTRSIEGAVIQPVVGAWSDRLWTRLGRRRPFMLIAMPLCALFMALTPLAPSLPLVVACIFLFSLLFNVAADPYTALQADIAPPAQRPMLSAVAKVAELAGQVSLGLLLGLGLLGKHIPPVAYPIVAAVILLTFLITIVAVPERREDVHLEPRHRLSEYLAALQGHHQALRYLVALFLYNVGINTILVNLTPFATRVLRVSESRAVLLFMLLVLVTGLFALPAAWLAARVGLKRVIAGGMVLIAVATPVTLVAHTMAQLLPALLVAGVGNAALSVLTWPLLTMLVPPERVGVFAGLKTSAESISALFTAVIAAGMVGLWGYRSIFVVLLVAIVASLAVFATIRVEQSTPQMAVATPIDVAVAAP
jgi:Na+/melibiose symporter-like transporter